MVDFRKTKELETSFKRYKSVVNKTDDINVALDETNILLFTNLPLIVINENMEA